MEATSLITGSSPLGLPAPYWFIVLFKVLGFTLHFVPMSIWLAGILIAMISPRFGEHGKRLNYRLMTQMPVIISAGVNLGIVPLLFVQVAYYKVFYPATILMAWPWLAIIALLCVAYYCVYIYAVGLRRGTALNRITRACGWAAAVLFIIIGYIYAQAMHLMSEVGSWPQLAESTSIGGAPLGIAMFGGGDLGVRFVMAFGIAVITTGVYILFDAQVLAGRESPGYRKWAAGHAFVITTIGLVLFGLTGGRYFFAVVPEDVRSTMTAAPHVIFTALAAALPALAWLVTLIARKGGTKALAITGGLVMFLGVGANAISRQLVQNLKLGGYLDLASEKVATQLSPLILFLVLFVAGVGLVIWMVMQTVKVNRSEMAERRQPGL